DKLVIGGYVEKTRSENDGRISYVVLTDKGRKIQPAFEAISANLIEKAYENFSDEETQELMRLLKKLSDNFS
ncbi:MAG: MarR family transcriptional regulator, partial [Clostridiales bacterium]